MVVDKELVAVWSPKLGAKVDVETADLVSVFKTCLLEKDTVWWVPEW